MPAGWKGLGSGVLGEAASSSTAGLSRFPTATGTASSSTESASAREIDTFGTIPAGALSELHRDPPHPVPGVGNGILLGAFDAEAAEVVARTAAMDGTSPLLSVEVRHLEGAVGRPDPRGGVLSHIEAPYALYAVGATVGPVTAGAIGERLDDLAWALAPWATGKAFLNFTERPTNPAAFFPDGVYDRLAAIRAEVDPAGRMRANHVI